MVANQIPPTVQPCIKCGTCSRYASGKCKACSKAYNSEWQKKNPEKIKAYSSAYYAADPEKFRVRSNAHHHANPEKAKAAKAAARIANPEKERLRGAEYRKNNPDKARAKVRKYYAANSEKLRAAASEWQRANPEAVRIISQNRRARKIAAGGKLTNGLSKKLFKLQKGLCPCCKKPLENDFHLDHIMPLFLGGSNTDDNIQLLRSTCNHQKNAAHPVDFMQSRGFLL